MDKKLLFEGKEPNISNPDLMLTQNSTRDAFQSVGELLDTGVISGCVTTITAINYSTLLVSLNITAGYVIIDGEIMRVDDTDIVDYDMTSTGSIPNNGRSYYMNLVPTVTYDPLGDKTFVDGTAKQTWQKTRAVPALRNSYDGGSIPQPAGTLDIALLSVDLDLNTSSISLYVNDPITIFTDNVIDERFPNDFDSGYPVFATGTNKFETKLPIWTDVDPGDYHFTISDFELDGTHNTLDLSSIVPSTAKVVQVCARLSYPVSNATTDTYIIFRDYTSSGEYSGIECRPTLAPTNYHQSYTFLLGIGTNGLIRYRGDSWASSNSENNLQLTVTGYY